MVFVVYLISSSHKCLLFLFSDNWEYYYELAYYIFAIILILFDFCLSYCAISIFVCYVNDSRT